jgi:flavin-dependent dehydrogenase
MIIIIGDGLASFALGAHLEKFNIDYLIFSKLSNKSTNSYGLTIQESDNILKFLDITFDKNDYNFLLRYVKIDANGNILESNYHSKGNYVISRQVLLEKLIKKTNIDKLIQYNALTICDKYIVCDSKIYKYDLLVGADGVNSDVRKYLNVNDTIQNTGYKFRIYKLINSLKECIKNDCIEYLDPINKIRIFIKPNGSYNASAQIYYPQNSDFNTQIFPNLPDYIKNNILKSEYYESLLNTAKKFEAPVGNIILLGDSYNAMTPYNGNGANIAITNAHHLANIIKNTNDISMISVLFYSKIYEHTWKSVESSYKAFLTQFENASKLKTIIYDNNQIFGDKKPNYFNNDISLGYKLHDIYISELYLQGAKLTEFPKNINKLIFLKKLNLSDNLIQFIPDLSKLIELKELYLRNNNISNLDGTNIDKLKLKILRLSYNNLSEFNQNINSLEELCLTGNNLITFTQFCENLTKLYLSENRIECIQLIEFNKIKYLRLGYNPIKISQFENQINKEIIKELKVSIEQNDINLNALYLNLRYGFQINIQDRRTRLELNQNYNSTNKIYDTNLIYSLLLLDINKIRVYDFNKIHELFKYLTLYLNNLLDLSDDLVEFIRNKLKFNKNLLHCLIKNKSDKNNTFEEIYKKLNLIYKNNIYHFCDDIHTGLPINKETGRPYFSDLKCLYPKCGEVFSNKSALVNHLNLYSKYIPSYHLYHEYYIDNIIRLFEQNKIYDKCPLYSCKFYGNLRDHFESLGLKPFWTPESKIMCADENCVKYNITESDNCIVCLENKPNILYECLHKCICDECYIELDRKMICTMCNEKSHFIIYY